MSFTSELFTKMKRLIPLLIFLVSFPLLTAAQSTTVSGSIVDAGSQSWNNGSYTFTFVPNPLYPIATYTWTGGALALNISGSMNGSGAYSQSVPSNSAISPIGSSWRLQVCPQATSPCYTIPSTTITGATQTLNATPPAILINLQTAVPPISAYATSEVTGAVLGSQFYLIGTGLQVCSAVSGNSCTTWTSAGGGGLTQVGSLPATCTPGTTAPVQLTVAGTYLGTTIPAGAIWSCVATNLWAPQGNPAGNFSGSNPYYDIRTFGAREVDSRSIPATTATMSASSTTATLASGSSFQNGDGVRIIGAGVTCPLTTPSAPTVTPSNAAAGTNTGQTVASPAGSTSYAYEIVVRNTAGCLTAASSAGSTSTGLASLGGQSVSITSLSKTNGVVSVVTSSANTLSVGTMIQIVNTSDSPEFGGWYVVNTVTDTTHFSYLTPEDSRLGTSASATGGAVYWWNSNKITWSSQSGDYEYIVYGPSCPGTCNIIGISRPTEDFLEDYGSTMMGSQAFPTFVPTSAPSTALPGYLSTTIVSGGGTNTVTLANASSNAVAGAEFKIDAGPALRAALAASTSGFGGGYIYIPADTVGVFGLYPVQSYTQVPASSHIAQIGQVLVNDTIELAGDGATWEGLGPTEPNVIVGDSNVGFYLSSGRNFAHLKHLNVKTNASVNGKQLIVAIGNTSEGQFEDLALQVGNGSPYDYIGVDLYFATGGAFHNYFKNIRAFASQPATTGLSATPVIYCLGCGANDFQNIYLGPRAILWSGPFDIKTIYDQGPLMPLVSVFGGGMVRIQDSVIDTGAVPTLSILSGTWSLANLDNTYVGPSADTGGFPPAITGVPASVVRFNGSLLNGTYQTNLEQALSASFIDGAWYNIGTTGPGTQTVHLINEHEQLGKNYALYTSPGILAAPTCNTATGGPPYTPSGTYYYYYEAEFPNGGESAPSTTSAASCTANGTSQQITVTIGSAVTGAIGYRFWHSNGLNMNATPQAGLSIIDTGASGGGSGTFNGSGPAGMQNGNIWANVFQAAAGSSSAPGYAFTNCPTCGLYAPASNSLAVNSANGGLLYFAINGAATVIMASNELYPNLGGSIPLGDATKYWKGIFSSTYNTPTNCNVNGASPAACGAAAAGAVVVPTTTTTYTINTTAVTTNSRIFILPITDATGLSGSPTCTAPPTPFIGYVSGRTAATSFTFTLPSTSGTSCWEYWIVN